MGRRRRPVARNPAGAATRHGRGRPRSPSAPGQHVPVELGRGLPRREDFAARYAEVLTGATGLEGGWRIYSSGPGVLLRIVVHSMLGVRRRAETVEIDPVLPSRLDGLTATVPLAGGLLRVRYHVGDRGHGPAVVVWADATSRRRPVRRTPTDPAVSSSTSPTSTRPCDRTATSSRSSCRRRPDPTAGLQARPTDR